MRFSDEQLAAINTVGSNILVSAGAGSGKTAVLTERIYHLYSLGTPFKRFLVLTFTEAAAMEMKQRTRKRILDSEFKDNFFEVDEAHIQTFDAFCLYLVKRYSYILNIDSNVSIVDKSIIEIEKRKIIDEIFKEKYLNQDPAFIKLIKTFCVKDDDVIIETAIKLSKQSELQIDSKEYLNTFVDRYFSLEHINKCIDDIYNELMSYIDLIIDGAEKLENINDADKILKVMLPLKKCFTYDELFIALKEIDSFPTKPRGETTDGAFRDSLRDIFNTKLKINPKKEQLNFGTSEDIKNGILENKEFAKVLVEIVQTLDERLAEYKRNLNCYTFSDIAHMCLELIKHSDIVTSLKNEFDYILVDEYQDTSDIQEKIITSIGNNNIFMVGDIKQSIYRFRSANPKIFQDKYDAYKKGLGGVEIDLNKSYRSREEIVDFINDSFDHLMDKKHNPIDYKNGHHFEYGNKDYKLQEVGQNFKPEIITYDDEKMKSKERIEKEINLIADDIIDKMNNHYQVYDKHLSALRDVSFNDFAIIVDRGTNFEKVKEIFTLKNIPLFVQKDEDIKEDDLSLTIKSLATFIHLSNIKDYTNPLYKHSFVSLARSFLVGLSDQEIYNIINEHYEKKEFKKPFDDVEFVKNIGVLNENYRKLSIYETIYKALMDLCFYEKIMTIGDYNDNAHKMEFFLDIAKNMDIMNFSLSDFIEYFKKINEYNLKIDFKSSDSPNDAVNILTIHKSKGLEYPICYYPFLDKAFNREEINSSILIDDKYGLSFPTHGDNPYQSLVIHLIRRNYIKEDSLEKIRLYYVALTRAREKIIMYGKNKKKNYASLEEFSYFDALNDYISLKEDSRYSIYKDVLGLELDKKEQPEYTKKFTLDSVKIDSPEIIKKKASKSLDSDVSEELLAFGTRIHYLLEIVDYESKDTSFIKDLRERKIIDNVLKLDIFKDVKNSMIKHEFEFYDEINDVNGVIDCLIVKADMIHIVDFKLKNISDEKYKVQLQIYKDYISQIARGKVIKTSLLSVLSKNVMEVDL